MMPTLMEEQAPVALPAYQRAQARQGSALHMNALTLVTALHLLGLCRLAVRLAHRRCPPPLPAGPGGAPRIYSEESLLLISLLRTLWRLSYQDMRDWLKSWPALARACGLPLDQEGKPRIPSLSHSSANVVMWLEHLCMSLSLCSLFCRLCDLDSSEPVISSLTVLPSSLGGAAILMPPMGMLPLSILSPWGYGFRVHMLICRGSGLPLFFLLSPANSHDAPFAQRLLAWAMRLYQIHPRVVRLDAAYWG